MSNKIGVNIPTILMPNKNVDPQKWAVIACDQYTSQPEYWQEVEKIVGDSYSTLKLTLPEVYLEQEEIVGDKIEEIHTNMKKYLNENILVPQKPGFIYVERKTEHTVPRRGLILSIDLEQYDYNANSQSLVRPTEKTVIERIPPRVKIRENATVEFPHIMLLIDDPTRTIIEPISQMTDKLEKLYDIELMMDGGHITGHFIEDANIISDIVSKLEKLADRELFNKKYNITTDKPILLFSVGDGNHSLASAKAHWENVKKTLPEDKHSTHPARYALVEVVNIHDESLLIEPIHRALFNVDANMIFDAGKKYFEAFGCQVEIQTNARENSKGVESYNINDTSGAHSFAFITKDITGTITVKNPKWTIPAGTIQNFLDDFLSNNPSVKIDYIHGTDVTNDLGVKEGNMGFALPDINKDDLFKTIIFDGVLPRKTFSMGEAHEKRYYIEGKKIVLD